MRIYFLRHGIAEERGTGKPDSERQLTAEGIQKLKAGAKYFEALGVEPAVVYTSPLIRAHQTAEIVAKHLACPMEIKRELSPGFDNMDLGNLLRDHRDEAIMVVGHEPDFSYTINRIISGGDIKMKKGGLARVDLITRAPLRGILVWLLPPRVLL